MDLPPDFRIYLASQSPRRHSLLGDIGLPFTVVESDAVEQTDGRPVKALAEQNALAKVRGARLPSSVESGAFVLGIDTMVSLGRRIMGKPESAREAAEMVQALSGHTHRVVSGVALSRLRGPGPEGSDGDILVKSVSTEVTFAGLDDAQIAAYVDTGEWRGKAGGYAVQGLAALFVRGIEGEYSNVVGLPLHLMYAMFSKLGFDVLRRRWIGEGDQ